MSFAHAELHPGLDGTWGAVVLNLVADFASSCLIMNERSVRKVVIAQPPADWMFVANVTEIAGRYDRPLPEDIIHKSEHQSEHRKTESHAYASLIRVQLKVSFVLGLFPMQSLTLCRTFLWKTMMIGQLQTLPTLCFPFETLWLWRMTVLLCPQSKRVCAQCKFCLRSLALFAVAVLESIGTKLCNISTTA